MKTISFFISAIIVMTGFISNAQQSKDSTNQYVVIEHGGGNNNEIKTLFGCNHSNGFYLSYDLGFNTTSNIESVENGGRMAWIIGHSMALGLFGSSFINTTDINKLINGTSSTISLTGGYGGFLLEPIVLPKQAIHLSFPIEIGVGGVGYTTNDDNQTNYHNQDAFMVFKPGVEVELNMVKCFRLALGIQYRYIYGLNLQGFGKNELNGVSATMAFKFGKF